MSEGADLLDDVEAYVSRFIAFPSEDARVAFVLWVAHTHVVEVFESTPRLALLSPEPGSGKTRALEIAELLVPRPMFTWNSSAAALYRKASDPDGAPTVLLDECDTVFGPHAAKEHEELRGFVNAGHRRGASTARCEYRGKEPIVKDFPCFAAVALAGLGDLPDTIMSRSVVIRMRRRAPGEQVEPFRRRLHGWEGQELSESLQQWTSLVAADLGAAFPEMPKGISDRPADVWEALLAVADEAGEDWPDRARVAAVAHVAASSGGVESLGVRLLREIKEVFDDLERISTEDLIGGLIDLEESPWGDLRGKALDARGLATRLRRYSIKSHNIRLDDRIVKGFERADFHDSWSRYVAVDTDVAGGGSNAQDQQLEMSPSSSPDTPRTSATSATSATCPHGMADGNQPDTWLRGRLACPECRAVVQAVSA